MSGDSFIKVFADNPNVGRQEVGDLSPEPVTTDTLKFSNAGNGEIHCGVVKGGREDCADFNRFCRQLWVGAAEWHAGGAQVATIKGRARGIMLEGKILTHGRVVDVDIDNYSDQSHEPSQSITLNLSTRDGSPVRWRSWLGCRPKILNLEQRYDCVFCLPFWLGILLNRGYQLLKLLRICK